MGRFLRNNTPLAHSSLYWIIKRAGITQRPIWPTAILVGRDGKVAYVGDPRDTGLEKAIETLLAR